MSGSSPKDQGKVISGTGALVAGSASVQSVGNALARPPDDHEVYSLVGRVTSEWAHLEFALDRIIWDLAGLDGPRGACLTGQYIGVWPRFDAIDALLTHWTNEAPELDGLKKSAKEIRKDANGPSTERNRIIHDPWYADVADGKTSQRRSWPRGNRTYGLEPHDREKMLKTIEHIRGLTERVNELGRSISAARRPDAVAGRQRGPR